MPESWRGGGAQATRRIAPVVSRLPFPARSEPRANDSHLAATSLRPTCAPSPDWSIDHRTLHSMLCPEMAFTVNGSNGKQRVNKWLMQWLKRLGPIVPREATDELNSDGVIGTPEYAAFTDASVSRSDAQHELVGDGGRHHTND